MPSSEQTAPGPLWYKKITKKPAPRRSKMAIPDPPKAGSPFCALWTGGWNPKTPKINNFFIPEITLRGGYAGLDRPLIKNRAFFSLEASARPASNEGQKSRGGKGEAKRAGRERPRSRSTLDAFRRLRLLIRRKLKKQGHRTLNIPHMAAGGRGRRLEPKNDRGV